MKLDIAEIRSLAEIAPSSVASYLRSRDWKEVRVENDVAFFHQDVEGDEIECDVPLRQNALDYPRRIREVLGNLVIVEGRSQYEIYQDLMRTNQDVVRISIDAPESGRVGLDEGGLLFAAARDLVLAAACSACTRRAYFPRRKPQRALDYVRSVNLAAPEAGSFVVVLESRLPWLPPTEEDPFERTALITLAMAAVIVQKSIEISTVRGSVERFSDDVAVGVNANYCDALATMLEEGPGRDVSIAFTWAPCLPMYRTIPSRVVFSRDEAAVLRAASKFLKERAPVVDFELVGQVVRLEALAPEQGGHVTVAGLVDDAVRQVQFAVGRDDYRRAIDAHQHQRVVSVEGELVKDGRLFRLQNPRMFSGA